MFGFIARVFAAITFLIFSIYVTFIQNENSRFKDSKPWGWFATVCFGVVLTTLIYDF